MRSFNARRNGDEQEASVPVVRHNPVDRSVNARNHSLREDLAYTKLVRLAATDVYLMARSWRVRVCPWSFAVIRRVADMSLLFAVIRRVADMSLLFAVIRQFTLGALPALARGWVARH